MRKIWYCYLLVLMFIGACGDSYSPKPIGYYRIDLPEKEYKVIDSLPFPFIMQLPQYSYPNLKRTKKDPNFFNIDFPKYGARIHFSYVPVNDTNLSRLLEDSRDLVFKHTIKAQDIGERVFQNKKDDVYGILYEISGNTASSSQFFLTDSTDHFLRGALYFNVQPNPDSIAPVGDFIREDIAHLIETFQWKN